MIKSYEVNINNLYNKATEKIDNMLFSEEIKFKILKLIQAELGIDFLTESLLYDNNKGAMVRFSSDSERDFYYKNYKKEHIRLFEENKLLIDEMLLTKYELRERQIKSVIDEGNEHKDGN